MSSLEQQKNINFGAKLTGKIAAGIYLVNNRIVMTLPGGGQWVPIGNAGPGHELFILMPVQPVFAPSSVRVNDYFELRNPAGPTETQSLWYRYGKRAVLYCEYALSFLGNGATTSAVSIRVSSINVNTLVITAYPQSIRTLTVQVAADSRIITHVFPLVAPSADAFYIELLSTNNQQDLVIVEEAFLSLGE